VIVSARVTQVTLLMAVREAGIYRVPSLFILINDVVRTKPKVTSQNAREPMRLTRDPRTPRFNPRWIQRPEDHLTHSLRRFSEPISSTYMINAPTTLRRSAGSRMPRMRSHLFQERSLRRASFRAARN
jgi:hypothetical protein